MGWASGRNTKLGGVKGMSWISLQLCMQRKKRQEGVCRVYVRLLLHRGICLLVFEGFALYRVVSILPVRINLIFA